MGRCKADLFSPYRFAHLLAPHVGPAMPIPSRIPSRGTSRGTSRGAETRRRRGATKPDGDLDKQPP